MKPSRFEIKYIVPMNIQAALLNDLGGFMGRDLHTDPEFGEYPVHSLYLDSPLLRSFNEKEEGISQRLKLRIRSYEPPSASVKRFLEIKERVSNQILKRKTILSEAQYEAMLRGVQPDGIAWDRVLCEARYYQSAFALRPVLTIHYQRRALTGRHDSELRITLDSELAVRRSRSLENLGHTTYSFLPRNAQILEIKFNRTIPFWAERLVQKYSLQDFAFSKYYLGILEMARRGAICLA